MMDGKGKLMGAMGSYNSSAAGDPMSMPGMVAPDKGFELKSGSKGKSSGPAPAIVQHLSDKPTLGAPESESPSMESEEGVVEPGEGFEKEPVA